MRGAPELLFALTPTLSRGERGILKEEIVIANNFITSANELAGYRIVRNLGIVRGIIVRSRSVVGTIGAGLQSLFGGNITLWTELCEQTRREAFELMAQHAQDAGGNAIVGMRYDTTEIAQAVAEVLAYGTAVVVEADRA